MNIRDVRAVKISLKPQPKTPPRQSSRRAEFRMNRPTDRYARGGEYPLGDPGFERAACVVTAQDGTWGLGLTQHGAPAVSVINDHLGPALAGEDCMATEKLWDLMLRLTAPYGGTGLASYAISAVDTALWDLKGKLLQRPVYELLGGPQKERIFCYATGFDTEWYMELGFKATKVFTQQGASGGADGIKENEDLVASTRELVGDRVELMLDCWLSMDVEHLVRLAEVVRPYRLKWIEDYLPFDDLEGYAEARRRLPWQTLATGEHWYLPRTFATAAKRGLVDILQPDVLWGGGITAGVKICHLAEAFGLSVITHAGMNYPYGQHLAFAMPAIVWGERSQGVSEPGVPLEEMVEIPGTAVVKDGYLVPSDAPGFGFEVTRDWLEEITV